MENNRQYIDGILEFKRYYMNYVRPKWHDNFQLVSSMLSEAREKYLGNIEVQRYWHGEGFNILLEGIIRNATHNRPLNPEEIRYFEVEMSQLELAMKCNRYVH